MAQLGADSGPKQSFDIDNGQRFADWRLTVSTGTSASQDNKDAITELYATDELPAKLHYVPRSARLGGTYREAIPDMGTVDGGKTCEPKVNTDAQGRTTLSWPLTGIPVDGGKHIIHFSTSIGDMTDPGRDIDSQESLETRATVRSKNNMSQPSTYLSTVDTFTIRTFRHNTTSLSTSALQAINEASAPIGFTSMLAATPRRSSYAIDILPHRQSGKDADSHGQPVLADMSIKATGFSLTRSNLDGVTIRYTTDPGKQVDDTASITSGEFNSWSIATLDQETGKVDMPKNVTAWALIVDARSSQSRYDITFHLDPGDNSPGDLYRNRWGNAVNQVPAQAMVVQRSVSGMAWYDENGDGIRSADDTLLKDVRVTLLGQGNQPVKSVVTPHQVLTTKTDAQGHYRLTDLPAGDFHLRFDPAPDTDWAHLTTTAPNADRVAQSENSSAGPLVEKDVMKGAVINDIRFQEARDMNAASQSMDFKNCGLTGPLSNNAVIADMEARLQGRDWRGDDSFTLTVEPLEGAPAAALSGPIVMDASHKARQVPVNINALPNDGSYRYRVKQTDGSLPGLAYDQGNAMLTIIVKTNVGKLHRTATAAWTDDKGDETKKALFVNVYKAKPATVTIKARKQLEGRSLREGEFRFRLMRQDGSKATPDTVSKADGTISFSPLTLTKAGIYTYQVSEVPDNDLDITYDSHQATVSVSVTDDADKGQLQARITSLEPVFDNVYKAPVKPDKPSQPDKPATPATPDKPDTPAHALGQPGPDISNDHMPTSGGVPASGSRSPDTHGEIPADTPALAASGSDAVMPAALTLTVGILGLALMIMVWQRKDQWIDLH